jgi:hypothetical protein
MMLTVILSLPDARDDFETSKPHARFDGIAAFWPARAPAAFPSRSAAKVLALMLSPAAGFLGKTRKMSCDAAAAGAPAPARQEKRKALQPQAAAPVGGIWI